MRGKVITRVFENFSDRAIKVVTLAREEAKSRQVSEVILVVSMLLLLLMGSYFC
jgi:hypothetical protein